MEDDLKLEINKMKGDLKLFVDGRQPQRIERRHDSFKWKRTSNFF